ncbi:hypothetical protein [uncultured Enterovirga sp.]|uniref:hypothetical protein n=1 Tax=uncultured Enterovirga sp. TaxID=2026352 RepID=UPI0035C9D7CD
MVLRSRKATAILLVLTASGVCPCFAQTGHFDQIIAYWACDGTNKGPRYSAVLSGSNFSHTREGGTTHGDTVINYITWDGGCWQAKWDDASKTFAHARFPSGADAHSNVILNYITWDDSLYAAARKNRQWYHIKIGPSAAKPKRSWIKQAVDWLKNQQTPEEAMQKVGVDQSIIDALNDLTDVEVDILP